MTKSTVQRAKRKTACLAVVLFVGGCGGNAGGGAPTPLRKAACEPDQTAFVDVSNELDQSLNIYAYFSTVQSGQFVGIARPGETTFQMPEGALRVYVAGHTATETPIKRTGLDAAVRFAYRCE